VKSWIREVGKVLLPLNMCLAAAAGFFGPKSDGRVYKLVLGSQSTDAKVSVDCVGGIDDGLIFFTQIIDKLKKKHNKSH
jgi:hypothetical protein